MHACLYVCTLYKSTVKLALESNTADALLHVVHACLACCNCISNGSLLWCVSCDDTVVMTEPQHGKTLKQVQQPVHICLLCHIICDCSALQ